MDSQSSCRVIVFGGYVEAARDCTIEDRRNTNGTTTFPGVEVIESNPISLNVEATLPENHESMYDTVHLELEGELYTFDDVVVDNYGLGIGDGMWADVFMSADSMSVRQL